MKRNRSSSRHYHGTSFCWFLLLFSASLFSQTIHFQPLTKDIIEARLKQVPAKSEKREETLKRMFIDAGCSEEQLSEQAVKRTRSANLICVLPGETDSSIIVGGHYDAADQGRGVIDNWSGASLLPSIYESLKKEHHRYTFVFVSFCCEEQGLIGSDFYVKQLTKEQVAKIPAMVNMDSLGLSSTKVEGDRSDKRLLNLLWVIAQNLKLPVAGVGLGQVGLSDTDSFQRVKVPVISIHSVTQQTIGILHSNLDDLSAVKLEDYYDTYRLVLAFLSGLDVVLN